MAEKKDIHLIYEDLTKRYRNNYEIIASFVRINTTNTTEIQEIYQKIKKISVEINLFPFVRLPIVFSAYRYNNRYLKSYWLIFKMLFEEFRIKFDLIDHPALEYFFNKEYGFPKSYKSEKSYGNYTLDLHEKKHNL